MVLVLALSATGLAVISSISSQRADGILIDAAGRQRMLNQRFIKEILVAARAAPDDREAAVAASTKTRQLFQTSLDTLTNGGLLMVNPALQIQREVPAASDPALRATFERNKVLSAALVNEATRYLQSMETSAQTSPEPLLALAAEVHKVANAAVKQLVALSDKKIDQLVRTCITIATLAAVIGLLISGWIARNIARPIKLCQQALQRAVAGDLTATLQLGRRDEIGDMANDIDQMLHALQQALGEDHVNWTEVTSFFRDLRSDLQRVQSIVTQSPLPMILVDLQGRVSYLNPAASDGPLGSIAVGDELSAVVPECESFHPLFISPESLRHTATIVVKGEHLAFTLEPIEASETASCATLVTWDIVTKDVHMEQDLRERMENERQRAQGLTVLIDEIGHCVESARAGNLTVAMSRSEDASLNQIVLVINSFIDHLRTDLVGIEAHTHQVVSEANSLSVTTKQIESQSASSNGQCTQIASHSEAVSELMSKATSTTEQISQSITAIADRIQDADDVASEAVVLTQSTNGIIGQLSDSSAGIGSVLKIISSIAEQTNLLALNATIEAARAGEAGKGFAVVANEVKELAKQTAAATGQIAQRIESIQTDSQCAVEAISSIDTIVNKINAYQSDIATSIHQQSTSALEMSQTVRRTAEKSEDIHRLIAQLVETTSDSLSASHTGQTTCSSLEKSTRELDQLLSRYQLTPQPLAA